MMARFVFIICMILPVAAFTGCRTSEANYRAAYEQAVAGREDESGIDRTVYDKIRREAVTAVRVVDGDTVSVKRERVRLVEAAAGEKLQEAYVVVGQFKQLFNARSLCKRLQNNGYAGATLLSTREPLYYIAIAGGTTADMVAECRRYADRPVTPVKSPYPLVLQPVR